jgi:hypothetical protein
MGRAVRRRNGRSDAELMRATLQCRDWLLSPFTSTHPRRNVMNGTRPSRTLSFACSLAAATLLVGCSDRPQPSGPFDRSDPAGAVQLQIPAENPGPPFYTVLERGFYPHTDEWAAVTFIRDPACVPTDFNLLDLFDVPAAFGCALTVSGHLIYKDGPPPASRAPIAVQLQGLGAVPIWFVRWSELQAGLADDALTVSELLSMPSLLIGTASFFKETEHPGTDRPQGVLNGKIEITARGTLTDGRSFFFQMREMGVETVSVLRHVRIEFR